jgi:hypothetical protein
LPTKARTIAVCTATEIKTASAALFSVLFDTERNLYAADGNPPQRHSP